MLWTTHTHTYTPALRQTVKNVRNSAFVPDTVSSPDTSCWRKHPSQFNPLVQSYDNKKNGVVKGKASCSALTGGERSLFWSLTF